MEILCNDDNKRPAWCTPVIFTGLRHKHCEDGETEQIMCSSILSHKVSIYVGISMLYYKDMYVYERPARDRDGVRLQGPFITAFSSSPFSF